MYIITGIIYVFGVLFAISWGIGMRHKVKREGGTEKTFETFGLLMVVSLILIPILSLSPFHLLWMFPASFLLGLISIIPPFRLLWPLASLYSFLWYIGLKPKKDSKIEKK